MRKILMPTVISGLLIVSVYSPASWAVTATAGKACTKAGLTSMVGDKKFTCIKSGAKLIWDKGVATPKPTPKPGLKSITKATPSPTPSARLTINGKTTSSANPAPAISKVASPSASPKTSPSDAAKISDNSSPIPKDRAFKIGNYTIQVVGAKSDVSLAVCKANVYNDGCLGDAADDKNVVDPKSDLKWVAITVSVINNGSSEATPSDDLSAEIVYPKSKGIGDTEFVTDYQPLLSDLVLAPGIKGTADWLFQVPKTFGETKPQLSVSNGSGSGATYFEVDYSDYVTNS